MVTTSCEWTASGKIIVDRTDPRDLKGTDVTGIQPTCSAQNSLFCLFPNILGDYNLKFGQKMVK